MKVDELLEQGRDLVGARRVFGEPYEKNGVTVIPAAKMMGGAGGGGESLAERTGDDGQPAGAKVGGQGAGYGLVASPVGAFVIKGDNVAWMPAIDVNRLMLGFQVVAIVLLFVIRSVVKTLAKRK